MMYEASVNIFEQDQLAQSVQAHPGVRGHEVQRLVCNHKAPRSILGNGCQLWDFH